DLRVAREALDRNAQARRLPQQKSRRCPGACGAPSAAQSLRGQSIIWRAGASPSRGRGRSPIDLTFEQFHDGTMRASHPVAAAAGKAGFSAVEEHQCTNAGGTARRHVGGPIADAPALRAAKTEIGSRL